MLNKYNGASYETYNKITNNINGYYANELYHNEKHDKYFFINSQGYLHIYIAEDKNIIEYLLTKDNKLKYINDITPRTKNQKINFIELLKEATPV